MTHKMIGANAAILIFCLLVVANPKPNFRGAWVMDRGRSFGMPGNMQQTMTVTHITPTLLGSDVVGGHLGRVAHEQATPSNGWIVPRLALESWKTRYL